MNNIVYYFILLLAFKSCTTSKKEIYDVCEMRAKSYVYLEQMPQFPGGTDSLNSFLTNNLIYPENSKVTKTEGSVIMYFVVDTIGAINCIKVFKSLNVECDSEAKRLITIMPDWIPGIHNGVKKPVSITLEIKFEL